MRFPLNKILLATCCFSFLAAPVFAQEAIVPAEAIEGQLAAPEDGSTTSQTASETETETVVEEVDENLPTGEPTLDDMLKRTELNAPDVDVNQIASLFFSAREHSLLSEARQGFVTRPPGEGEIDAAENGTVEMGPRTLSLGGIVYVDSDDWVVWLNGQRVSATAIPPEVLDITVTKSYVKLQWFDEFTNQIFPVKLRAHQRFNIDTRIFLPG